MIHWLLIYSLFFSTGSPAISHCGMINGKLKTATGQVVKQPQKLLIYKDDDLSNQTKPPYSRKDGSFHLDFCVGTGPGDLNIYSVTPSKDTLLLASIESFNHGDDRDSEGNFFMPKKLAPGAKSCPACRKSDRVYALVYVKKEQKDFLMTPHKYFCLRDRRKF
jgi:hypothetical protein